MAVNRIANCWEVPAEESGLPNQRQTHQDRTAEGTPSLEMIRDFLGHVDVKTTQVYARVNLEMKRNALEKISARYSRLINKSSEQQ
jgi:integrase